MITIMRDRFVRGWPRHERGESTHVLPLDRALTREYTSDAHFAAYVTPNSRRLTRESLDLLDGVELTAFVFDVDCAEVHGSKTPAPPEWRSQLLERVDTMARVHAEPFVYMTRCGGRIVYRQQAPIVLHTADDARRWSQDYAVAVAYIKRRFGIVADPACADWQRLYRLPRATRDHGSQPERWPVHGDAANIGTFEPDVASVDVIEARRFSRAFDPRRSDFAPSSSDGLGLLYHALRARGHVYCERPDGSFIIKCPNVASHSCGRAGDSSTVLFRPARGSEIGHVHCLHGHCAGLRTRDWLRLFDRGELDAARSAAGIVRHRAAS